MRIGRLAVGVGGVSTMASCDRNVGLVDDKRCVANVEGDRHFGAENQCQ